MKKIAFFYLSVLVLTMGCKAPALPDIQKRERAELHIANFYHPLPSLDMELSCFEQNQATIKDLKLFETWPQNGYASLLTMHDADSTKLIFGGLYYSIMNHANGELLLPKDTLRLQAEKKSSMIIIDVQGKPTFLRTLDNFETLDFNSAGVRFIDLSPNSALSVGLYAVTKKDTTEIIEPLNFLNYTPFKKRPIGKYVIAAVNDQNKVVIAQTDTMELMPKQNYAFYLLEDGQNYMLKAEQIKP
jgi:hypothetical protein